VVKPHLPELIQRSCEPEIKLIAVGSPFETKDVLKGAGYRWDGEQRAWHKTVHTEAAETERQFLAQKVYRGAARHIEETIWFNPKKG
jgi:DNA polymerase III subunit epsilon